MQNVESGEGNASRADLFHCRLILGSPGVRKREPIQRIATWLKMRLSFPRDPRSPINQCPEYVKKQSLHAVFGTARHCLCRGRGILNKFRPACTAASKRHDTTKQATTCYPWHLRPPAFDQWRLAFKAGATIAHQAGRRLIGCSISSRHKTATSHSRRFWHVHGTSAYPPLATEERTS